MGRSTREEHDRRLGEVEQALLAGTSRQRCERIYSARWDVHWRTIRRYIEQVEERWFREATEEERRHPDNRRRTRRTWAREVLKAQLLRASARRRTLKGVGGEDLVDEKQKPLTIADPDESTVTKVMHTLIKLDGLAEPEQLDIRAHGVIEIEARVSLEAKSTAELITFMQTGHLPKESVEVSLPESTQEKGQNGKASSK